MSGSPVALTAPISSVALVVRAGGTLVARARSYRPAIRGCFCAPLPLLQNSRLPFLQQRRGAGTFNKYDAVSYAGRSRNVANAFNPLELNLFDDPTGGLITGPAEELPAADIASQVRLCVATYSRSHFYLLFTPFVDVLSIIFQRGLAPDVQRPGEVMARWFTDAVATLQNPTCTEEAMGLSSWQQFCAGLDKFYEDVEPVMPLTSAVRKHGLPEQLIVPFMRQLAMELLLPARRRAIVEILPGLILGLANGRAPPELGFPGSSVAVASVSSSTKGSDGELQRKRAIIAADLFLGVGQETGNTDFAYLGIQLLRANDIPVPFPKQKQLTNVFSAATRIQTDWQMRASGQLVEVLPRWMDYYKTVYGDNMRAMKRLQEKSSAVQDGECGGDASIPRRAKPTHKPHTKEDRVGKVGGGDDGVHDYFTSNQGDDVARVADLESRIEECVRKRDVEWRDNSDQLYSRFKRKRSSLVENPVNSGAENDDPAEGKRHSDSGVLSEGCSIEMRKHSHGLGLEQESARVVVDHEESHERASNVYSQKEGNGTGADGKDSSSTKSCGGVKKCHETHEIWVL